MINLRKTLLVSHELLQNSGVRHALIGGFALSSYGFHRATLDIDFLAEGSKKNLIIQKFLQNGFELKYQSDEVLQFIGFGFVDVLLANRPLSLMMLDKAIENSQLGVYVVQPEDFVGLKIQAYMNDPQRELQDKADIQNILKMPHIKMDEIKKYADLFGEWNNILKLK